MKTLIEEHERILAHGTKQEKLDHALALATALLEALQDWGVKMEEASILKVPETVESKVILLVAESLGIAVGDVKLSETIFDLGADSLDAVEISMTIEDE